MLEKKKFAVHSWEATLTNPEPGKTLPLKTNGLLLGLFIRLHGNIVIAVADGTAWVGNQLKGLNLMKNISLIGDGVEEYIKNVDLAQFARRATILRGLKTEQLPGSDYTICTDPIDISFFVPFYPENFLRAPHPEESLFACPAFKHKNLVLSWDERPFNEMLTPAATTTVANTLKLSVTGVYDTERDPSVEYGCIRYKGNAVNLTAEGTGQKLDLSNNEVVRSLFLDVVDNSIPDDDIIGNLDLEIEKDGITTHPINDDWEQLQAMQDDVSGILHSGHGYTTASGALLVMLDNGKGYGQKQLAGASTADLIPTVTTTPTATAKLKVVTEYMKNKQ